MSRFTASRLAALAFACLTTVVILAGIDGLAQPDTAAPALARSSASGRA